MKAEDHLRGQARRSRACFSPSERASRRGGSFRHVIYERMGFDQPAYGVFCGQGMNLSNLVNRARDNREVG